MEEKCQKHVEAARQGADPDEAILFAIKAFFGIHPTPMQKRRIGHQTDPRDIAPRHRFSFKRAFQAELTKGVSVFAKIAESAGNHGIIEE